MLNKKGMSPLLLTIILIAFAVALGAMIMTWSSDKIYAPKESCERVSIRVEQIFGKESICFNEGTGKLKILVVNEGPGTISSLLYRKINADLTTRDIILPSSTLDPGKSYQAEVPHQQNEKAHIEIIPQIKNEEVETLCLDRKIVRETIPTC